MNINRNDIITRFPWLMKKNLPMIISADYDGLICAAFLSHYLNWKLEGYYDLHNIWISNKGLQKKKDLIWVDLNILPKQGRAIGGHIVSLGQQTPHGFDTSCNPNLLAKLTSTRTEFAGGIVAPVKENPITVVALVDTKNPLLEADPPSAPVILKPLISN